MYTRSRMSEDSRFEVDTSMDKEDTVSSQLESDCDRCDTLKRENVRLNLQLGKINDQIDAFETFTHGTEYRNKFSDQLLDNVRKIIGSETSSSLQNVTQIVTTDSRKRRPSQSTTDAKSDQTPAKRSRMVSTRASSARKLMKGRKSSAENTEEVVASKEKISLSPDAPMNSKRSKSQPRKIDQPTIYINPNLQKIKLEQDYNQIDQVKAEPVSPASTVLDKILILTPPGSPASSTSSRQKKISMRVTPPECWKFKTIRSNIYFGPKPILDPNNEDQLCACRSDNLGEKCVNNCLNKMVFIECPKSCGENCKNRRIQMHEICVNLRKFRTPDKGLAIKTGKPIREGAFILEYVGEIISRELFTERVKTIYAEDVHHYALWLEKGMVLDAYRVGGQCRFVNHCCQPNCEMLKWYVNGLPRMGLFARRDIETGEELSYDCSSLLLNPNENQVCHCGSSKCRGIIGGMSVTTGKKIKLPVNKELTKSISSSSVSSDGRPNS